MAQITTTVTISQARKLIQDFQTVFDVARLVDPIQKEVLHIDDAGVITHEAYACHSVWKRVDRCENCISMKVRQTCNRCSKYEFVDNDVFQVVANPFELIKPDGTSTTVVLELVNNVTDEIVFEAFGKSELIDKINRTNKKIYQDSLTHVYNRRYFDERVFCYAGDVNLMKNVCFVMVDMKQFKSINDNYGHDVGDEVLTLSAKALKKSVRTSDAVIRLGGDEFLVVLKNCPQENIPDIVEKMRGNVGQVVYDEIRHKTAVANFGWSFAPVFLPNDNCIEKLLGEADKHMYHEKRRRQ